MAFLFANKHSPYNEGTKVYRELIYVKVLCNNIYHVYNFISV